MMLLYMIVVISSDSIICRILEVSEHGPTPKWMVYSDL